MTRAGRRFYDNIYLYTLPPSREPIYVAGDFIFSVVIRSR